MKSINEIKIKRDNNFILDSKDYQVLSMLYKPLIDHDSLNIYSSLYILSITKENISLTGLLFKDMTADDSISNNKILESINKLSNVKLISKTTESITIYPPYKALDFFNLPLSNYLTVYTSKEHFKHLSMFFLNKELDIKSPIDNDLQNLSKSLKYCTRKTHISTFDFNEFKNIVSTNFKIDNSDELFLTSIANVYNLSANELASLYYDSMDDTLNKQTIIKKAYERFEKVLEKEKRLENKTKNDEDYINYFLSNSPEFIISNNKAKMTPSKADENTIYRMRNELNLKDSMISLLISYSLSTNNNKLHPFTFFKKISDDWTSRNIITVEDAFLYINSLYEKTYKTNKTKDSEISSEEWFENFWKKAKEEINK